nr:MAG TPA: hypothetical protein [Caudoviricetes sp.]
MMLNELLERVAMTLLLSVIMMVLFLGLDVNRLLIHNHLLIFLQYEKIEQLMLHPIMELLVL